MEEKVYTAISKQRNITYVTYKKGEEDYWNEKYVQWVYFQIPHRKVDYVWGIDS